MDENLLSPKISFSKPFPDWNEEDRFDKEHTYDADLFGSVYRYKEKKTSENVRYKENSCETLQQVLSRLSLRIIDRSRLRTKRSSHQKELLHLETSYKNAMEKFQYQLEKFLRAVQELRQVLKKTVIEFHKVSKMTAQITLLSAGTEIAFLLAHCAHKLFDFSWNPHITKISTLVGAVSVTASLFALSYMKHSTAEISRHVRNENRIFLDLIFFLRKGSWIDEEVLNLFPHGISSKLITDDDLEKKSIFKDKMEWKHFLCYIILLTNVQKDEKLLNDDMFLEKVKSFIESKTAEIWWHRIKLRKLLDDLLKKMDEVSAKEFIADHEVHYKRTALYLYTILIPWLMNAWNSNGLRIVCSTCAAILALNDLESNDDVDFQELQKLSQKFEKDFQEITKIYEALENDYD